MSMTIEIPPDVEAALSAEARRLHLPLAEYALRILSTRVAVEPHPQTGAELVEYWKSEGVIESRPDISDSQSHAREVRRQAERRTRD